MNPPSFSIAVKTELLRRRKTITALAKDLGYARNTVSMAIHHTHLPRVRAKVAKRLQLEISQ